MGEFKNITTQAYVVEEKGAPFKLQDVILDEIHADEVLIEIKYTGLCHTDIVVQHGGMPVGAYPAVLGHEGVGVVRQVGSGVDETSLKPGDTVILSFRSCKSCDACTTGRCGACPQVTELNFLRARRNQNAKSPISLPNGNPVHGQFFGQSSLSRMAVVAEQSVVKCDVSPEDLPFLAPLACGYATGAGTVFNALDINPSSKIVVLGVGAVGLAALLAAKAEGAADIIAVDMVDAKLDLATSLGATYTVNTKNFPDFAAKIRESFPDGVNYVLDATGVASLLEASLGVLAHGGVLALVGVPHPRTNIQIDALDLLLSCKRIIGVIEGFSNPKELIPRLVKLYKDGQFPVDRLSKIYPAKSLDKAIADLKAGVVIKPILAWDT